MALLPQLDLFIFVFEINIISIIITWMMEHRKHLRLQKQHNAKSIQSKFRHCNIFLFSFQ